jgi:hypothetical protein
MGGFLDKVTPFPPGARVIIEGGNSDDDEKWKKEMSLRRSLRQEMDFLNNLSPT